MTSIFINHNLSLCRRKLETCVSTQFLYLSAIGCKISNRNRKFTVSEACVAATILEFISDKCCFSPSVCCGRWLQTWKIPTSFACWKGIEASQDAWVRAVRDSERFAVNKHSSVDPKLTQDPQANKDPHCFLCGLIFCLQLQEGQFMSKFCLSSGINLFAKMCLGGQQLTCMLLNEKE